jgi:hypothetical protein
MDPVLSRLTVFDTAGTLHAAHTREFSRVTTIPWLGGVDGEGLIYDLTAPAAINGATTEPPPILVRYRPDGDRLAGIDTLSLPAVVRQMYEERTADGSRLYSNVPFSSAQRWSLGPDGSVWVGMTAAYRLVRISFTGDTLATVRHTREPVAVTRAERDSVVRSTGIPADRVPAVKPAFRSLFVDDEGRLWVAPYTDSGGGTEWDVFSASGEHLASLHTRLRLETESVLPVVRGGFLYAVATNELDVPFVVRMPVPDTSPKRE